mmetsp:Transcript_6825/g.22360  ORF Transcript_6825/g.22360 Transcript_6825/m.22360 type:complete len:250 (-) Transcript_6825:1-750(-)
MGARGSRALELVHTREPSKEATMPARVRPTAVRTRPSGKSSGSSSSTIGTDSRRAGGPMRHRRPAAAIRIDGFIRVSKACWATVSRCSMPVLERWVVSTGVGKEEDRRNAGIETTSSFAAAVTESAALTSSAATRVGGSHGGLGATTSTPEVGESSISEPQPSAQDSGAEGSLPDHEILPIGAARQDGDAAARPLRRCRTIPEAPEGSSSLPDEPPTLDLSGSPRRYRSRWRRGARRGVACIKERGQMI